jgi:hypothetical protein
MRAATVGDLTSFPSFSCASATVSAADEDDSAIESNYIEGTGTEQSVRRYLFCRLTRVGL